MTKRGKPDVPISGNMRSHGSWPRVLFKNHELRVVKPDYQDAKNLRFGAVLELQANGWEVRKPHIKKSLEVKIQVPDDMYRLYPELSKDELVEILEEEL